MKAYIQANEKGDYYNVNAFIANEGFSSLGFETVKFIDIMEIEDNNPEDILVGGIGNVRKRLEILGLKRNQEEIDYPKCLSAYFGRKIWTTTIQELFANNQNWNVFIKPKDITKLFAARVVREYKDFIGLVKSDQDINIWCSEVVDFVTEWRCFIRYGQILDVRYYKGAWNSKLDLGIIKRAVRDYKDAPAAYSLDFGIDKDGIMKLVEINDGHSLGTYGISPINYAKFLTARWSELTNTVDHLRYI